jgi:hypothetical protein
VLGEGAHPFEVGGDVQAGEREAQVGGDGLLPDEQLDDGLLDLFAAAAQGVGHLEGRRRRRQVTFQEARGGPAHRRRHVGAHDDERAAKAVELFPERCPHPTPPASEVTPSG